MNQIKAIQRINDAELQQGILLPEQSWHDEYRNQAYIFIGGLNRELTEADILTVFSQYGSPVDLKLVRDRENGDSKGFAYLKYEDQRSTILAVDNLNGVCIAGRVIKVDHTLYEPREDDWEYREAVHRELDKDKVQVPTNLRLKDITKGENDKPKEAKGVEDDELADPMGNQ
ncbi:IST3 (YIR005W) [Zygosaccharomyces parabailii]|uniref:ZYBA0S13-02366g1_1 n=1 Tax=Zygosaccharomyces bailii (strain CLIB 213 / ATCC 58445 / CBS 680 / BCRC 21525 / NBRC 1098 / NCYC 1416 / NRRL Y-2227) TaxID=1333698 RepID=A0A8J2TDN2_ZYGB2|nr:IST3 (YIR005W) [Zygosaccharomyces parabailii]CDF91735.1 ZYBA0S13-02366g1_1 [Zygosaccharomyces bailii CLIB 213]CDH12343.1 related to U2 snRNP component IST3 [Zygosaccharomyces bailii ISA1307]